MTKTWRLTFDGGYLA